MAQSKPNITSDNITEWMASTGFLFPRTLLELKRFEMLYADVQEDLSGCEIDPEIILGRKKKPEAILISLKIESKQEIHFRMAARKGDSNIPSRILDKMKMNHDKRKQDDSGTKKDNIE